MLDKNSKIKSTLNLKNNNILNEDEIEKVKKLIIDTKTINNHYFSDIQNYILKDNYKDLSYSFDIENFKIKDEEFRTYYLKDGFHIEVSNLGRIKINNKLVEQCEEYKNSNKENKYVGYLQIKYSENNEDIKKAWNIIKEKYVYETVAKIFLGLPKSVSEKWEVHHITNNGYDNRVENLIWTKKIDHIKIHS